MIVVVAVGRHVIKVKHACRQRGTRTAGATAASSYASATAWVMR